MPEPGVGDFAGSRGVGVAREEPAVAAAVEIKVEEGPAAAEVHEHRPLRLRAVFEAHSLTPAVAVCVGGQLVREGEPRADPRIEFAASRDQAGVVGMHRAEKVWLVALHCHRGGAVSAGDHKRRRRQALRRGPKPGAGQPHGRLAFQDGESDSSFFFLDGDADAFDELVGARTVKRRVAEGHKAQPHRVLVAGGRLGAVAVRLDRVDVGILAQRLQEHPLALRAAFAAGVQLVSTCLRSARLSAGLCARACRGDHSGGQRGQRPAPRRVPGRRARRCSGVAPVCGRGVGAHWPLGAMTVTSAVVHWLARSQIS